jgi:DNA repair exonuclease SbcCD ATPase subunit
MVEESPPEFKFSADEQDPETFYQEEIKDLQVEKLSQKVTLLTILLPILIGIAIFFAYRDLTGRVNRTQDTGSMEIQRVSRQLAELSKEFNDKLITFSTTLSTQDKAFDTTVSEKLTAVNQNVTALNKNLKSLNEELTQTQSTVKKLAAAKADKKSQDAAFARVNGSLKSLEKELKSLAKLREELKAVSSGIKNLEGDLNQKITAVTNASEQSQKDYSQLQTAVTGLSDNKIDKDTFDLEVFKLKKNFQNNVAQEITAINRKLDAIQKKIDDIQQSGRSQKRSMKSLSKKTSPGQSTGPAEATTPSRSGSIDEQDLLE